MSKFKGQPTFVDIQNPRLRAFNRLATFYNLTRDMGQEQAKGYIENFDDISKVHITNMIKEVQDRGYSTVHRELSESVH